jgi:hypothetical protein
MTKTKTIKLTKAQKEELPRLMVADEIHQGVIWFRKFTHRRKGTLVMDALDGRVCNALVKKGVLVAVESDLTRHTLHLEGVEGYEPQEKQAQET